MKPNPNPRQPEPSSTKQRADWFDDSHDSVLILEGREYEENGASSDLGGSCRAFGKSGRSIPRAQAIFTMPSTSFDSKGG